MSRFQPFDRSNLDHSLHACFSQQATQHGAHIAIRDQSRELAYAALEDEANAIAGRLLDRDRVGTRTALLLPQGCLLTAAILGVLKTGGAYVPLDPARPGDWNAWQLANAECDRLLCAPEQAELARTVAADRARITLIDVYEEASRPSTVNVRVDAGAMACIYYTSGSTGRPKGVCDSHRNILHNVLRYTNSLRIAASDRLSLVQSPVFSGTLSSLFGALLNGASLACVDIRDLGLGRLGAWIQEQRVTIYHSVPSIFRALCVGGVRFPSVRLVRLEGDQASSRDFDLFRRHFDSASVLVYGLGATECGLVRQHFLDPASAVTEGALPLGVSLPDMETQILDEAGETVAPGMIGEIAIRSRYLALGYWREPELTRQCFSARDDGSGERVYRTGDLGTLNSSGSLEYRGRVDQQWKIDGQHVDLARVEAMLRTVPGVADAVAQTRADDPDQPRLLAYLVAESGSRPALGSLRAPLAARLPPHMIPTRIVWLDSIPLSADGKVDRKALPPPTNERPALENSYVPPRSPTESKLVALWEKLLGVAPIGIDDNFLDLGGTSIIAMLLLNRLRTMFDTPLGAAAVFECPTVEKLAARIDEAPRRADTSSLPSPKRSPRDPRDRGAR